MNNIHRFLLSISLAGCALGATAQSLVLLHTNDTHSHIDAEGGVGGVLQRKAIVDSIRRAEKNVLLIDAGDIVQGSLYYKLFGGAVEYPLMKLLGYDIQILGNHEFDNGVDELSKYYTKDGAVKLSSNYTFSDPALNSVFRPWVIKTIGGKKVGFLGLNLDPDGIIGAANSKGVEYHDILSSANATAAMLRSKGCSTVVAVTHIGYTDVTGRDLMTDPKLATLSRGIDIIIGGHSHTVVTPGGNLPCVVNNADGKPVLIVQTGRYGANLGYIKLDLSKPASQAEARMIPVAGIDSARYDKQVMQFLAPYRQAVDSINSRRIALNAADMMNSKKYAESVQLTNLACDVAALYADHVLDSIASPQMPAHVDLALMNSGGIRLPFPKGEITEGQMLSAFPFTNRMEIVELTGRDLAALLQQAATQGGQGLSGDALVSLSPSGEVQGILIAGEPIVRDRKYYVATLDYLADGGDYLEEFKKGRVLWSDDKDFCAPMMQYIVNMGKAGIPVNPDPRPRFITGE